MVDTDSAAKDSEDGDLLPVSDTCKKLTTQEKIYVLQVAEEYPCVWDTSQCIYNMTSLGRKKKKISTGVGN